MSTLILQRSALASRFHRRGAVFVYHDVFGYLLEASPDILELIDAFAEPTAVTDVVAKFVAEMPQVAAFIDVLQELSCLIEPGTNQLSALDDMYPIRARWSVVQRLSDGSIQAVQGRSTDIEPTLYRFNTFEAAIWRRIDGETSVRSLARQLFSRRDEPDGPQTLTDLEQLLGRVRLVIASWVHSDRQWARVSAVPASFYKNGRQRPPYLDSTMPYPGLADGGEVPADSFEQEGIVDLRTYHRDEIHDAAAQFDLAETTLSHMFRTPHPALKGGTYTSALVATLKTRGMLTDTTADIAEIGGGTGDFAAGMLTAIATQSPQLLDNLRYQVVDISPALQKSQRRALRNHAKIATCITSDAERLTLSDNSLDLLISNEMLADLRTARVATTDLDPIARLTTPQTAAQETMDAIEQYELPVHDASDDFFINLGAFRFLEQVQRVLKPGGAAFISEFGDSWRYPLESTQLDHPEFSIHFGHLRHVALRLGLQAEVIDVLSLLGFDPEHKTIAATRTWYRNLGWLVGRSGPKMKKIAYTKEMLKKVCGDAFDIQSVPSIAFEPLADRALGLRPTDFKALLVRKPLK